MRKMVPLLDYPLGRNYLPVLDKLEQVIHDAESQYESKHFIIFTSGNNNYIHPHSEFEPIYTRSLKVFLVQLPTYSSSAGKTVYITAYGFDHKVELSIHYSPKDYNKKHPWGREDYNPVYNTFIDDQNIWGSLYEAIKHIHNKPLLLGDPIVFHDFCVKEDLYAIKRM